MTTKKEFQGIKKNYYKEEERFNNIKIGDLVWEAVPRWGDIDYHPAIVDGVNVDERCVEVIDISSKNERKRYYGFLTESELMKHTGISKKVIEEEYIKYRKTIDLVVSQSFK